MGSRGAKSGIVNRLPNYKNAIIEDSKITNFLLKPGKKHYNNFVEVGYTQGDAKRLRKEILEGLRKNKAIEYETNEHGEKAYEVDMILGVTSKELFVTGWQFDKGAKYPRFITAFMRKDKK